MIDLQLVHRQTSFPDFRKLLLLSEMNKINREEKPIIEILKQPSLMDDHLNPYLTVLEKAKTPYEIFGAVWGARNRVITNLLPKYPEWKIVYYEDLLNGQYPNGWISNSRYLIQNAKLSHVVSLVVHTC